MSRRVFFIRFLALLTVVAIPALHAADWDRFRGPNGSGVTEASGLPAELGPTKNVVWKRPLPPGHSSPIISGGRIFLTAFEGDRLLTISLDRASGQEIWRREAPRPRQQKVDRRNSPASPTPVADGRNVYVFFQDAGLLSYDFAGRQRWVAPLGPFNNVYGMGASPVLVDGKVVLVCDQGVGSFAVAFTQKDGKQVWRRERPEAISGHSTPVIHRPRSGPAQILAPGSLRMDAYSAADGASIWWVTGLPGEMKSGPVLAGDTVIVNGFNTPENDPGKQLKVATFEEELARVDANKDGFISRNESGAKFISDAFVYLDLNGDGKLDAPEWKMFGAIAASENGLLAYRLDGKGNVSGEALRWKYQRSVPQLPTTLLYQGTLYMINDGGILTTLDPATGEVKKQARLRGAVDSYYASPVAADGKVYVASRSGIVTVLKPGGEQEVLAVNELDDEIYATPAIDGGRIYIRTRSALYAFGK